MKGLRLGIAALTKHCYVGRLNKAGDSFLDGKHDVTSDFLRAVIDRFGDASEEHTIRCSDGTLYTIKITVRAHNEPKAEPAP